MSQYVVYKNGFYASFFIILLVSWRMVRVLFFLSREHSAHNKSILTHFANAKPLCSSWPLNRPVSSPKGNFSTASCSRSMLWMEYVFTSNFSRSVRGALPLNSFLKILFCLQRVDTTQFFVRYWTTKSIKDQFNRLKRNSNDTSINSFTIWYQLIALLSDFGFFNVFLNIQIDINYKLLVKHNPTLQNGLLCCSCL